MPSGQGDKKGLCFLYMSDKDLQRYDMKTGDDILDVVPWKLVNKAKLMEDIAFLGKMSPLKEFEKQIGSFPGEDILFIWDMDGEITGDDDMNFLFCYTQAQFDKYQEQLGAKPGVAQPGKESEEEKAERLALEEQKRLEEEAEKEKERVRLAVEELKKEHVPRAWKDQGSLAEILAGEVKPGRQLYRVRFTRERATFGEHHPLTSEDSADTFHNVIRPEKRKDRLVRMDLRDVGIQASKVQVDSSCQTKWSRKLNRITQYEPQGVSEEDKRQAMEGVGVQTLIKNAMPLVEAAVRNLNVVDLFQDDFACFPDEEQVFGTKLEHIKEVQTFQDILWSREKRITCMRWMPENPSWAAVACCPNTTFDQRIETSGQSQTAKDLGSWILLWNLDSLIMKAKMALKAPAFIASFSFCPTNPNIVVAGLENGQIAVWDIADDLQAVKSRDRVDEEEQVRTVLCERISHVEGSHDRPVTDIQWLPPNILIEKGDFRKIEKSPGYHFMTVAGDGQLLFWDVRAPVQTEKQKRKKEQPVWEPVFSKALSMEGRVMGCMRLLEHEMGSVAVTTEAGEFGIVESYKAGASKKKVEDPAGEDEGSSIGLSQSHCMAVKSLERSPHFPSIYLSIGDWSFTVWRAGEARPLFESPYATTYLTCGCWSPTRPGVIITAKIDGSVDVWDLLDQTHQPVVPNSPITSSAITSISYCPTRRSEAGRGQKITITDAGGSLRVLEVPRNFAVPLNKEKEMMTAFYAREGQRAGPVRAETPEEDEKQEEPQQRGGGREDSAKESTVDPVAEALKREQSSYEALAAEFEKALGLKQKG